MAPWQIYIYIYIIPWIPSLPAGSEMSCCLRQASAKKAKAPYAWKHADLDPVILFLEDEIAEGRFQPSFPFKGINYEEGYLYQDEDP